MDDTSLELADAQAPPRRRFPFTWLGLIGLAVIVFELTSEPALAAITVCLKFGWDYFLTALWLRRTDPNRPRGQAFFWLYLAGGLWKTALVAFLMTLGYILVLVALLDAAPNAGKQGPVQQALPSAKIAALTFLTAFGLSYLSLMAAVALAHWYRVRLWLNGRVHRARRENVWPIPRSFRGTFDLTGAMMLTYFLIGFVSLVYLFNLIARLLGMGWPQVLFPMLAFLVIGASAAAWGKVAAGQPWGSWQEETEEPIP
jgi:hypothetical protein